MKRIILVVLMLLVWTGLSFAENIGTVKTKGMVIKDTLTVVAFDDPTIKGITCYTTVQSRALSFSDSSSVSLSCRKTGEIKGELKSQKNVFSKSKNPFFKKTVVDRFYDAKRGVLIYLTYTTATGGDNNSNSVSVVVVNDKVNN
jgi:CreA protein